MVLLGYERKDVLKIFKTLPAVVTLSITNITNKIDEMIKLGFSKEQVLNISKLLPSVFTSTIENLTLKMNSVIEHGYSKEETIDMICTYPAVFSTSVEGMKEKLSYYDSIDMHDLAIKYPRQLMQGVALSYAKYHYFKNKGILVTMENYYKLFESNKVFEKREKITKKDLLNLYSFEEYKRRLNDERIA